MHTMGTAEALAFLAEGSRTGKLATASPTGAPHVTPVWFVLDADRVEAARAIVFKIFHDTVKARHLTANPRAVLTADDERFPFSFALVRGSVTIDRAAADLATWTHRIAARYVPADRVEEFGRRNAVAGEWLCRLSLDHVIGRAGMAD